MMVDLRRKGSAGVAVGGPAAQSVTEFNWYPRFLASRVADTTEIVDYLTCLSRTIHNPIDKNFRES